MDPPWGRGPGGEGPTGCRDGPSGYPKKYGTKGGRRSPAGLDWFCQSLEVKSLSKPSSNPIYFIFDPSFPKLQEQWLPQATKNDSQAEAGGWKKKCWLAGPPPWGEASFRNCLALPLPPRLSTSQTSAPLTSFLNPQSRVQRGGRREGWVGRPPINCGAVRLTNFFGRAQNIVWEEGPLASGGLLMQLWPFPKTLRNKNRKEQCTPAR